MAVVVPDIPDLFEEAYARAGLELRTGNDLRNARRSFNLLTMEWQNRGLNLWTIASGTLSLSSGTATYTMPTDTVDILEHQIRTGTGTSQVDTNLTRISVSTYAQQSAKNTQGKPTQIFVQRLAGSVTVTEPASLCTNICVGLPCVFFALCCAYVDTLILVKFVST